MTNSLSKVDTFVVLMLENRSFDHMLGFLRSPTYPIEGLDGSESNPLDPNDPSSQRIQVARNAAYVGDLNSDPGHSLDPNVITQLYGLSRAAIKQRHTYPARLTPRNNGFVYDYGLDHSAVAGNIMKCFDPSSLPVLAGLAQDFAIGDHWFSSLPGPTHPNRWFVHCGTSGGYVGSGEGHIVIGGINISFPVLSQMTTVQHLLSMRGRSWKVYFHDIPHTWTLMRLLESLDHFGAFESFKGDAASGSLPNYSFIEPRYFGENANDQHPPHDVRLGEQLIADVYNAVRASPQWDRCLLIVTYDEHGGLYDHVGPARTISPDDLTAYDEFDGAFLSFKFNRLGVRVPAVLISPYVPEHTVWSTICDHTSVLRTLEERFELPTLTHRDASAASLGDVLSLDSPRTDTPSRVMAPTIDLAAERLGAAPDAPLTEFQRSLLALAEMLPAVEPLELQAMGEAARPRDSEKAAQAYIDTKVSRFLASR